MPSPENTFKYTKYTFFLDLKEIYGSGSAVHIIKLLVVPLRWRGEKQLKSSQIISVISKLNISVTRSTFEERSSWNLHVESLSLVLWAGP